MTLRIMLDLETMSTAANAAITQIGACANDERLPFWACVRLENAMKHGGKVDASTIMWWLTQSDEARKSLVDGDTVDLPVALRQFSHWLGAVQVDEATGASEFKQVVCELWAYPAQFDVTILGEAYRACGLKEPWHYRAPRCLRTAAALAPDVPRFESGVKHDALADAASQMIWLEAILARLGVNAEKAA